MANVPVDSNTTDAEPLPWLNAKLLNPNPPLTPEEKYIKDGMNQPLDPNHPLAASGFQGILTIDLVLRLLTKVTDSLQACAVVKADKVSKILVPWQNSISDQMKDVHLFSRNKDAKVIRGGGGTENDQKAAAARDDMNRINSSKTEGLRSDRSMITDEIKMQQTGLQSLQDTISQATNLFNTIIGKLSSINSSLFR